MPNIDLSVLQAKCVRLFADGQPGADWTRLRQTGPTTRNAAGGAVTPAAEEMPFRAFVDEGGGRSVNKQPQEQGDQKDGTITLYCCQTQVVNGLDEEIDFTASDEEAQVLGDIVRREPTEAELEADPQAEGERYEVLGATLWRPGGYWAVVAQQVIGG